MVVCTSAVLVQSCRYTIYYTRGAAADTARSIDLRPSTTHGLPRLLECNLIV